MALVRSGEERGKCFLKPYMLMIIITIQSSNTTIPAQASNGK